MKLLDKNSILELSDKLETSLIVGNKEKISDYFLDEIRIGLTISNLIELPNKINFKSPPDSNPNELNTKNCTLEKGKYYLGITEEKLSFPNNILGIINTRSKFARIGLETVSSSWFVIPNFGIDNPTPIILEVKTFVDLYNVDFSSPVSYLLLFQIENQISKSKQKNYLDRFPFSLWQK